MGLPSVCVLTNTFFYFEASTRAPIYLPYRLASKIALSDITFPASKKTRFLMFCERFAPSVDY